MYQDIDAEISQSIRSQWKAFTTIKDVHKENLTRTYMTISSIALLCLRCYMQVKRGLPQGGRTETGYKRGLQKASCWKYYCMTTSDAKGNFGSEEKDMIMEYPKLKFCWAEHLTRFEDNRTHAIVT